MFNFFTIHNFTTITTLQNFTILDKTIQKKTIHNYTTLYQIYTTLHNLQFPQLVKNRTKSSQNSTQLYTTLHNSTKLHKGLQHFT